MAMIRVNPPLPNAARSLGTVIDLIVLHATAGGTATSSIRYLRSKGLGYHYVVERNGDVYACVPIDRRTGHTGSGFGPHGHGVNHHSIGVCAANRQDGEAYTAEQVTAIHQLCAELRSQFPTLRWVTTHGIIQPWNRSDPKHWNLAATAEASGLASWSPGNVPAGDRQPPGAIRARIGGRTFQAWILDGRSWARLGAAATAAGVTVASAGANQAVLRIGSATRQAAVVSLGGDGHLVKLADLAAVKGVQAHWDPVAQCVTIP
ncbi:MAG: N-acetylmuramoyl-L-alanine amidase [Fimbriimonadaceae bacterium]